jgi:hypothetical protein
MLSPEGHRNATRPHRYVTDSATKLTRAPFPMRVGAIRRMALHVVIIHGEADTTIARKTEAPHLSLRVHASSARLSGELDSQPDSDNHPTSSSTLGKQTLRCGLSTTA